MSLDKLLRIFIVAEFIAGILSVYTDFAFRSSLPGPLQQYLLMESQRAPGTGDAILLVLFLILLVIFVVAWVGLWMFKRWARTVYTTACVLYLVATLAGGPVVSAALAATFSAVSTFAGGIILGMIWLSDLRSRFEVHRA